MKQTVYQMIAFLLQYPDKHMAQSLSDIEEDIDTLDHHRIKSYLQDFVKASSTIPFDVWTDHYIEHFDFGRLTNLYVTYLKLGEQRERGLELLKLKKFYEASGYSVSAKELPDYLPVILEFCANVPTETGNELLQLHHMAIGEIRTKLKENNSYYSLLFDALFLQMEINSVLLEKEAID